MFLSKFWDDYKWASRGWSLTLKEKLLFFSSSLFSCLFFSFFTHQFGCFNHPAFFHNWYAASRQIGVCTKNEIIKRVDTTRAQTNMSTRKPSEMRRQRNNSPGLSPDLKHHISQVFKDECRTGDGELGLKARHLKLSSPGGKRRTRQSLFNISQIFQKIAAIPQRKTNIKKIMASWPLPATTRPAEATCRRMRGSRGP